MKHVPQLRVRRFGSRAGIFIVIVALMQAAPSAEAQNAGGHPEEVRIRLATFLEEMQAAFAGSPNEGAIATAREYVAVMTHEDLAAVERSLPLNSAFWESWRTMGPALARARSMSPDGQVMSHGCPAGTPLGATDEIIADSVEKAAEIAYSLSALFQIPLTGAATPLTVVLGGVWGASSIAAHVIRSINVLNDECEENNHREILHNVVGPKVEQNLNATVSSRATQVSLDSAKSALETQIYNHDVAINTNLTTRANSLDARIQTHDTDVRSLLNQRANQLEAMLSARATYIDTTLANVTDMKKLEITVLEIKEKERYLVTTSEAGVPVNVALTSIAISELRDEGPIALQNITASATVTPGGPGILDVRLPRSANRAQLYEFRVKHAHGAVPPIGNVDHFGVIVFHARLRAQ